MIVIISPAKRQKFEDERQCQDFTIPEYIEKSQKLATQLKNKTVAQLQNILKVSTDLSLLNFERYQKLKFPFDISNAVPALFAYKGDVYQQLQLKDYTNEKLQYAQEHLRIITGLYGILRPLDLIQAYRLEMVANFKFSRYNNLYQFWTRHITKSLNQLISQEKDKTLVNLASKEYFKVLDKKKFKGKIITLVFKELRDGTYKTIALNAKRARGRMVNFMLKNQITQLDDLKTFDDDSYYFNPALSSDKEWVFVK